MNAELWPALFGVLAVAPSAGQGNADPFFTYEVQSAEPSAAAEADAADSAKNLERR